MRREYFSRFKNLFLKTKSNVVGSFGAYIIVIDQATKKYALAYCKQEKIITSWLSLQSTFNRGISWGIFNGHSSIVGHCITASILAVYASLIWYTYDRYKQHKHILGELCVLAGGFSNLLDRFVYGGVVDFIILSYRGWSWPTFNLADAVIVGGAFLMAYRAYRDQ
jgi:signal peptidase II